MKIILKGFLITLILFNISLTQSKIDTTFVKNEFLVKGVINERLSKYQLKIISVDVFVNDGYEETFSQFILLDSLKSDTLSISSNRLFISYVEDSEFELKDINFDGDNDLFALQDFSPNGMNKEYSIYLFDNTKNDFQYNEYLTSEVGFNTEVDEEKQEIKSGYVDAHGQYGWSIYKYLNGELVEIRSEDQELLAAPDSLTNSNRYVRTLQIRKDDEMITIKEIDGTLEEIEENWNK
jgi:hypothetical protein